MKGFVYISYSRNDADIAKSVATYLERHDIRTYVDTDTLVAGGNFATRLADNIKRCEAVIFIAGSTSLNSQWCRREIEFILAMGKTVIPIMREASGRQSLDSSWLPSQVLRQESIVWDSSGPEKLRHILERLLVRKHIERGGGSKLSCLAGSRQQSAPHRKTVGEMADHSSGSARFIGRRIYCAKPGYIREAPEVE